MLEMASGPPKPLVYRLRGCPAQLNPWTAAEFLSREFGDISRDDIQIQSLTTDLDPRTTSTKVGTLMFKRLPALIETQKEQDTWDLKVLGFERPLVFDTHFRGMTPLNDVEQAKHEFNCLAISGLASHPFGSWQPKGRDKSFMWLRDELPQAIPEARISIYGYDTTLAKSVSFQSIQDLAASLIDHIISSGWALPSAKPLIFLAHSLGGIVLKEMFVILADSGVLNKHILRLFKGGIFFGVPSRGMSTSHLFSMVKNQPNQQMVHSLSRDSEYLQELDDKFSGLSLARNMRIYSGYETKESPTVVEGEDGSFTRDGPEETLVSKESATHSRYGSKPPFIFAINENHSEMVKFGVDDPNSRIVKNKLRELCQDSRGSNGSIRARSEAPQPALDLHGSMENIRLADRDEPYASTAHHQARSWSIKDLMESLKFPDQGSRFDTIDKNHEHTFEWVFDVEKTPFVTWLEDGKGFFWVHGKPGSGKSTLMKFIAKDNRTWAHLRRFSSRAFRISAMFFFHDRGTLLQKSFEGLLRSILHQIIGQVQGCGAAATELIEGLLRQLPPRREEDNPWSLDILENCLRHILQQTVVDMQMFILLDALDEHDMNPGFICRFLLDMMSMTANSRTKLKVLFSSRPWQEFKHQFGNVLSIQLQDYTKDDIDNYCWGMFDSRGEELSSALSLIIPKVVDRANGVFLWVKLALRELMDEASQKRNPDELEYIFNSIPSDLQDYYIRTLHRIPENLRWNAYVIFEVLSKASSLSAYILIDTIKCSKQSSCEGYRNILNLRRQPTTKKEEDEIVTATGNLVESITLRGGSTKFQFVHQTVREFVCSRDFKQTILLHPRDRRTKENGHAFLAKYYIYWGMFVLAFPNLFNHEVTTGNSLKDFIDSIPKECYDNEPDVKGPLSLAVKCSLKLYLEETLRREPDTLRNTREELISILPYPTTDFSTHISLSRFLFENGYAIKHIGEISAAMMTPDYTNTDREEDILMTAIGPIYIDEKVTMAIAQWQDLDTWFHTPSKPPDSLSRIIRRIRPHLVKILHEARTPKFTRYILDHGAEVNEPDSLGNTPLDHIIQNYLKSIIVDETERHRMQIMRWVRSMSPMQTMRWMKTMHATAILLIERGGVTRSTTREQLNRYLIELRASGLNTAIAEEGLRRSLEQPTTGKMGRLVNRLWR